MSKRTGSLRVLALSMLFVGGEATAQPTVNLPAPESPIVVSGVVSNFSPELGIAAVGDYLVCVDDLAGDLELLLVPGNHLTLAGMQSSASGLVRAIAIDVPTRRTAPRGAAGARKQSITGTGVSLQSITGTGKQSITGTGVSVQSITGTGKQSITGTGVSLQSITGTGKQSITGTGVSLQSITGTGKQSITGTGVSLQSITGTGKQSITGTGVSLQSITGTGK